MITKRLRKALTGATAEALDSDFVVPGTSGSQIVRCLIGRSLRHLCAELGLRHLTPHSLRHAFAVRAVNSGVNPAHIQRALGHSSLQTTDKYLRGLDGDVEALKAGFESFRA